MTRPGFRRECFPGACQAKWAVRPRIDKAFARKASDDSADGDMREAEAFGDAADACFDA